MNGDKSLSKHIGIKQAKKTLRNITIRKRRGLSKQGDLELERVTVELLKKWESAKV